MMQMHRRFFVCLFVLMLVNPASAKETRRPNVLAIVADNLGYGDVGYYGAEIRTPNLDRLAATGARLDQFYVYPMCSPTRAAFVSGRAPSRYGILGAIGHRSRQALPPETVTIADALAAQGYETAISGKWHLGLRPEVGPLKYGFQSSYGFLHGQLEKYSHRYKNGDRSWHRNDEFIDEEGHSLDLITTEALRFLEESREAPFFLYVPFGAPHPPLQEEAKWVEPYADSIAEKSRREYAAAVTHMDDAIGQLLQKLEETGQRERTLVVFFSDNGAIKKLDRRPQDYRGRFGPYPQLGSNGPYRGWIGELYDGCLHTPAVVHWPGVVEPRVVKEVTCVLDWFPTLLGRAGGTVDAEWNLEGRDIWPLLSGEGSVAAPTLYWKTSLGKAVREGNWKLVDMPRLESTELFRMDVDPYEAKNVAEEFPERVERLRRLIEEQSELDG